jgi:hypothetical protein
MQQPAFWAKIYVELADIDEGFLRQLPFSGVLNESRRWQAFCKTACDCLPDTSSPDFHAPWHHFCNGSRIAVVVFIHCLKRIKALDDWAKRAASHHLQLWLQSRDQEGEETMYEVYIAADQKDDFEFLTRTASATLHTSFIRITGVHDCCWLVRNNSTFRELFAPDESMFPWLPQ